MQFYVSFHVTACAQYSDVEFKCIIKDNMILAKFTRYLIYWHLQNCNGWILEASGALNEFVVDAMSIPFLCNFVIYLLWTVYMVVNFDY